MMLNYYGLDRSFKYYPYADILEGDDVATPREPHCGRVVGIPLVVRRAPQQGREEIGDR